jgi:uncharacterized membrane protein (UPF0127 family)
MRRTLLLLSTMMLALLLAGGVALAANIQCQGGPCVGTEQNDLILGSLVDDQIQALGGSDQVSARGGADTAGTGEKTPELPTVTIHASCGEVRVRVEVADDPAEQAKGLMDRTTLGENRGMLFVYPDERERSFWMKDTLIPLSIAFIDSERRIINIQDMKPLDDEPPHYVSAEPAQYALEVNQGFFEKRGVKVGDRVELPQ